MLPDRVSNLGPLALESEAVNWYVKFYRASDAVNIVCKILSGVNFLLTNVIYGNNHSHIADC